MANMVLFTLYIVIPTSLSEPDWVASEREQFTQFRDTDGNGLMDLEEVKVWMLTLMKLDNEKNSVATRSSTKFPSQAWIIPPDFDHSEAEAKVISIVNHHILLLS